jgi:hypothetical protein
MKIAQCQLVESKRETSAHGVPEQKRRGADALRNPHGHPSRAVFAFLVILLLGADIDKTAAEGAPPPLGVWSKPSFGSTPDLAKPVRPDDLFADDQGTATGVRMSVTGKPCVTVAAEARSDPANPKNFFHTILAANACSQRILIQVCYYQTQTCSLLQLSPYGRKEAMLGIMPAMKGFRYEYREQLERRPAGATDER